jgi:hypothetical protein
MWMILTVLTIVAGTVLLMWIGDQITEKGHRQRHFHHHHGQHHLRPAGRA